MFFLSVKEEHEAWFSVACREMLAYREMLLSKAASQERSTVPAVP